MFILFFSEMKALQNISIRECFLYSNVLCGPGQRVPALELIHLLLLFTFVTGKHESCFNNPLRAPARPTHLHTDTGGAAIVSLLCRLLNRVVR